MTSRCVTARKIVGAAAAAALFITAACSAHADGDAGPYTCGAACRIPVMDAGRAVVRGTKAATAQAVAKDQRTALGPRMSPELASSPRALKADRPSRDHTKHVVPLSGSAGAVEHSRLWREDNTGEQSLPDRGIPIPTVHIGVLPKPDHKQHIGVPGAFEVPGESSEDANRRRVLMHICISC